MQVRKPTVILASSVLTKSLSDPRYSSTSLSVDKFIKIVRASLAICYANIISQLAP